MPFGLSDTAIRTINDILKHFPDVEEAVLYGLRPKGNCREGSDILDTLNAISWQLDDLLLPQRIDLSIYKHIKNPNWIEHIERVGKTLFKKAETLAPNE